MPILKRKATTGSKSTDNELDRIYSAIMGLSSAKSTATTTNTNSIVTDLGATAYKVQNNSGILLPAGYIVEIYNSGITFSPENSRSVCAVIYKPILPYGEGYIIINGPCMVYFNSNGSTSGHHFRMSKSSDTAYDDFGKANSAPINGADPMMLMGHVWETRTGEGLAKCIKVR
jgi:hypothetical protein